MKRKVSQMSVAASSASESELDLLQNNQRPTTLVVSAFDNMESSMTGNAAKFKYLQPT